MTTIVEVSGDAAACARVLDRLQRGAGFEKATLDGTRIRVPGAEPADVEAKLRHVDEPDRSHVRVLRAE
jgi:hypothetical protein